MGRIYISLAWLVTLLVAYGVGWWRGVRSVALTAADAGGSGFDFALLLFVVVAALSAAIALWVRRKIAGRDRAVHE